WIDAYILHGPSTYQGLADEDWEAWRAMEALQQAGKTRLIGVSNVTLEQLQMVHQGAVVQPAFVQNRCYARHGWDREVRAFCQTHGIVYQGFSLLTANRRELSTPAIKAIASRLGCTVPQVIFRFALEVGMLPLTGTSNPLHMRQDREALQLALRPDEIETIAGISAP
ncbi:MAG: aldo/keto reductase, partial [Myxococcota bacterium]